MASNSELRRELSKARMAISAGQRATQNSNIKSNLDNSLDKLSKSYSTRGKGGSAKTTAKPEPRTKKAKSDSTGDLLNDIGLISKRKEGR